MQGGVQNHELTKQPIQEIGKGFTGIPAQRAGKVAVISAEYETFGLKPFVQAEKFCQCDYGNQNGQFVEQTDFMQHGPERRKPGMMCAPPHAVTSIEKPALIFLTYCLQ